MVAAGLSASLGGWSAVPIAIPASDSGALVNHAAAATVSHAGMTPEADAPPSRMGNVTLTVW
jgi:hypothetical protein